MRMKEVCTRTGLTDRAVRLYVESGLVSPTCARTQSGRMSIHFDEADVAALETVATLRRAGFPIVDIKAMQDDPGCIPTVLASRRVALREEIDTAEATLAALDRLGNDVPADYTALAARLHSAAPSRTIPKEDTGMSIKEIKQILRVRLAALLALVAAVVGVALLAPAAYANCFVRYMVQRDGVRTVVDYGTVSCGYIIAQWLPVALLAVSALLLSAYLVLGRRGVLAAAIATLLAAWVTNFFGYTIGAILLLSIAALCAIPDVWEKMKPILRARLPAVLALTTAFVGLSVYAQKLFFDCFVVQAGKHSFVVDYSRLYIDKYIDRWLPVALLAIALALLFGYIVSGRRKSLIAALILVPTAVAIDLSGIALWSSLRRILALGQISAEESSSFAGGWSILPILAILGFGLWAVLRECRTQNER